MGDLGLLDLAKKLRCILDDVKKTDSRIRVLENKLAIGTDPQVPAAAFSNAIVHRSIYPVRVKSVDADRGYFTGKVCKVINADGPSAFVDDDYDLKGDMEVQVPSLLYFPNVDDIVGAMFLGTTGNDFSERYALLDRIHYLSFFGCTNESVPVNHIDFGCCFRVTATSSTDVLVKIGSEDGLNKTCVDPLVSFMNCSRLGDYLVFDVAVLEFTCGMFTKVCTLLTTSIYICCCDGVDAPGDGEGENGIKFNAFDMTDLRNRLWNRFSGG